MESCQNPQTWYYRGREAAQELGEAEAARWHERAERFGEDAPGGAERACELGCTYCCHYPVGAREPELAAVAEGLREALSEQELEMFVQGLLVEAEERRSLGWDALAQERRPCPLLDGQGACRVHPARPLACRGWNSYDRDSCEREFRGDPGARPALDGPMHLAVLGLAEGWSLGLRESHEDGEVYELATGLARQFGDARDALTVGGPAHSC